MMLRQAKRFCKKFGIWSFKYGGGRWLLRAQVVQRILRSCGLRLPHCLAVQLNYRGEVPIDVNGKRLYLQSYNEPIEILIFWYGIFGKWERTQLRLWADLIKKADVVLDIGANTGVYSLIATTNPKAKIYAFEPVVAVQEMLETNIALNEVSITVVKSLVGDTVGRATMYVPRSGWVDVASMDEEFAKRGQTTDEAMQAVDLPITTVDAFLNQEHVTPEQHIVCKIDVEGVEDKVLLGMQQTLETHSISFTAELLTAEYFDMCRDLIPADYRVLAINESTNEVVTCEDFVLGATNYLFTKETLNITP